MKLKHLFIAHSVIALFNGAGCVLAPTDYPSVYGISLSGTDATFMARLLGGGLLTYCFVAWFARDAEDSTARRAIVLGFFITLTIGFNALDAVEMNQQPTECPVTEAPICPAGQSPTNLFVDDLEAGGDNWSPGANVGSIEWYLSNTYPYSGSVHLRGYNPGVINDHYVSMKTAVALPAGSTPYLHFYHAFAFENILAEIYDGGVIEYTTSGDTSWQDAGSLFTHNGYNGTIDTRFGNPLAGRQAFGAGSNGYISSRLDLSSLAGQNVRFRFRIGSDNVALRGVGWFIDDVRIYTCDSGGPTTLFLPTVLSNYDPSELLQNGDFDSGTWTPWLTMTLPALTDQVYHSAPYSARLAGRNDAEDMIAQEVTMPSHATQVTLDFRYRVSSDDPSSPEDYMCAGILDSEGNPVSEELLPCYDLYYVEPKDQWLNGQLVITGTNLTPLLGQTVFVSFVGWTNATNPSTVWVDDVSFKVTGTGP